MKATSLGKTGLHVSRIAFGTWQLGGEWGSFDEGAAIAAIRRARELGVNFFDTALLPRWREAVVEGRGGDDVAVAITQSAQPSHGRSLTSRALTCGPVETIGP